jgi:acyl-CoA thioesterase-1
MNRRIGIFLIKNYLVTALFCLLFPIPTFAQTQAMILVMGDSLSAEYGLARGTGWVKLLDDQLKQKSNPWVVFNASISGETSVGGLTRLPVLLNSKKPGIVLIELGANDALRGLTIEQTESNLRKMIELSKQSGAKVLLLGMQIPPNYGQEYTKNFKALYSKLAKQESVQLLPFFMAGVASNQELFQPDNIHPNEKAQPILLKNVWGAMAPYYSLMKIS